MRKYNIHVSVNSDTLNLVPNFMSGW